MRMRRVLAILTAMCLLVCCAAAEPDAGQRAVEVLEELSSGAYQAVYDASADVLKQAVGSAEGMREVWEQLAGLLGAYQSATPGEAQAQDGYEIVSVQCAFSNAEATLALAFDEEGRLTSLGLVSMQLRADAQAAAGDEGGYVEEEIALRPGEADETRGLLTLPEGEGPFPAVVMVHGSGSSDMNETAYANAPLRDIARGLARLGVASIRYDKYTYAHPEMCTDADFTVDDEYTKDAVDAAALIAQDARVGEIYLLGHSQGAMLAPRIMRAVQAQIGDRLAGGVLLAGSPLCMWEIQYRQNLDVVETLSGEQRAQAQAAVDAEVAKVDALSQMTPEELQAQTLFGISAWYQLDEMSVDAAQTAVELDLPLFIAQGEKDWQVRPEDGVEAWRAALPEDFAATFRLYEDVNHMLADMEGEPTGTAQDYMDADAHVSEALIGDIAEWIRAN